jgi:hypothetical protein
MKARAGLIPSRLHALQLIKSSHLNGMSRELLLANGVRPATLRWLEYGLLISARITHYSNPKIDVLCYHITKNGETALYLNREESVTMTKHVMNILDQTGHTTIGWDPDDESEVAIAKAAFDSARTRGYHAFHVIEDEEGGKPKRGARMETFNPEAEKMILMPQLQGG